MTTAVFPPTAHARSTTAHSATDDYASHEVYAPVALFVYNRTDNTLRTLQHLVANEGAAHTDLYIFSDGGRDAASWRTVQTLRTALHRFRQKALAQGLLRSITLVERTENVYLEQNIITGIAHVLQQHDRIIVLEDDICTAPHFLRYMNRALALYQDVPRVMHISGFTHLDLLHQQPSLLSPEQEIYFTPHTSGWGWATWRDRWAGHFVHYASADEALAGLTPADVDALQYGGAFPALHSIDRSPIPWDVCWEIAVYRARGLALTPAHTLVRNIGLQQGTHFGTGSAIVRWLSPLLQRYTYDRAPLLRPLRFARNAQPETDAHIEACFAAAIRDWGIAYTPLGRLLRWLKHRFAR